jgi:hypothetical protein
MGLKKMDSKKLANYNRSIRVIGEINGQMVAGLAPEILALRQESNEPITVFIDSSGGSIRAFKTLIGLLTHPDQQGQRPWINTFVLGEASSAAAELLSLGDHAIAYPHVEINFHGARISSHEVTAEYAKFLQYGLHHENWISSSVLADVMFDRLLEIYSQEKDAITQIRQETSEELKKFDNLYSEGSLDVPAFARFLSNEVNDPQAEMIKECLVRMAEYEEIAILSTDERFKKDMERSPLFKLISRSTEITHKEELKEQLAVLHSILIRRFSTREQWDIYGEDFLELRADFEYVSNSLVGFLSDQPMSKLLIYGKNFIPPDALKIIRSKTMEEFEQDTDYQDWFQKVITPARDIIEPLWGFAEMLSQALYRGEHELTPKDAWWLGLVDEVIGTNLNRRASK